MDQSLRICIVGARFPILGKGAEEGFLWPIAKSLAELGHEVTIISWQNPQKRPFIKTEKIEAYFLGEGSRARRRDFPEIALRKFIELHDKKPFSLVHSLDDSGLSIGKNRKAFGIAMSYDVAATQMAQLVAISAMSQANITSLLRTAAATVYKFLTTYFGQDRTLLKTADAIFVTTPRQAQILERYYLYPEYRTYLVPYGSDYIDLNMREKSDELRQKLGISASSRSIVTVSDMTETSDLLGLLRAFQRLVVKRPSVRLILVGNGPLWTQIRYEILNLALGSKVICTGAVSNEDLPDYLNLADVYVNLSSRTSGFEAAMLEAMVLQKVVVGSELSPMSTIIEDSTNGFLIRPADEDSLFRLLNTVVAETSPNLEIGARARETVLDIFDRRKMVNELLNGFKKTLRNTRRKPKKPGLTLRQSSNTYEMWT